MPARSPGQGKGSPKTNKKIIAQNNRSDKELDNEVIQDTVISYSSHTNIFNEDIVIKGTKSFTELSSKDFRTAFVMKCRECSKICDFRDPSKDLKAKNVKSHLLKHLSIAHTCSNVSRIITADMMTTFTNAMQANLVRDIPTIDSISPLESHYTAYDLAWPHISLAYECVLSALSSNLRVPNNKAFLNGITRNLMSLDPRERSIAKTYLMALCQRDSEIKTNVQSCIINHLMNGSGSPEMMECFYTMVSQMTVPLKAEGLLLFRSVILPLHCSKEYCLFFKPYVSVLSRYIAKSESLINDTIMYMIGHWPHSYRQKQHLFLKEVTELLSTFSPYLKTQTMILLWKKIGDCCEDLSSQISEAALDLVQSDILTDSLKNNASVVYFPLVLKLSSAKIHWNEYTRDGADRASSYLMTLDPMTMKKAVENQRVLKSKKRVSYDVAKKNWDRIALLAKDRNGSSVPVISDRLRYK